VERSTCGLQ